MAAFGVAGHHDVFGGIFLVGPDGNFLPLPGLYYGTKLDVDIPARPPVMCAGCPHRGLFYTLAKTVVLDKAVQLLHHRQLADRLGKFQNFLLGQRPDC